MTAILLNQTTYSVITRSRSGILLFAAVPQEKRSMTGTGSDRFLNDRYMVKLIKGLNIKNIFK
jgi:hypothetical protein